MSEAIQRRRGTTAQHAGFTGLASEITVDTTKKTVVVHDGSTAGGFPLLNLASILGTVAQSGGAPTGKIIETGSNANGRYVRFADGTQICWKLGMSIDITSLLSSPIYRGFVGWTMPASFASTSVFAISSIDTSTSAWGGNALVSTVSAITLRAEATESQSGVTINGIAIGRWF